MIVDKTKLVQILHQRAFLREERRRIRVAAEHIDERKRALKIIQRSDWLPSCLVDIDKKKWMLNVGGLMFEVPTDVLNRDSGSLLAQLTTADPPVAPDAEGVFYFDRDW